MLLAIRRRVHQIWCRLRRRELDRDFDLELRSHIAMSCDEKRRGGAPMPAARHAAIDELGDLKDLRRHHRELRERGYSSSTETRLTEKESRMSRRLLFVEIALGLGTGLTMLTINKLDPYGNNDWEFVPFWALVLGSPLLLRRMQVSWELRELFPNYLVVSLTLFAVITSWITWRSLSGSPGTAPFSISDSVQMLLIPGVVIAWLQAGAVRALYLTQQHLRDRWLPQGA